MKDSLAGAAGSELLRTPLLARRAQNCFGLPCWRGGLRNPSDSPSGAAGSELLQKLIFRNEQRTPMNITITNLSLVVLIGPSGSGKSTFARKHFLCSEVLSSDACRGMVSDDENNQTVTNEA